MSALLDRRRAMMGDGADPWADWLKLYFTTESDNATIDYNVINGRSGGWTSLTQVSLDGATPVQGNNKPTLVAMAGEHIIYEKSPLLEAGGIQGQYIGRIRENNIKKTYRIDLPNSVTEISSHAFRECGNLLSIYCYAQTMPVIEATSFLNTFAVLHVKQGLKNDYANDQYWLQVASNDPNNIIEDL